MKLKTLLLICLAASSSANAALYSLSNNFGGDSVRGITEKDGLPGTALATRGFQTTEAFAAFGTFSISDSAISSSTDPATLWAAFNQFGSNIKNFTAATGGANGVATPVMTAGVTVAGNATFENRNMYFVVANVSSAANITSTTQFFVYKTANLFLAADDSLIGTTAKTFTGAELPGANGVGMLLGQTDTYSFKTRNADTTAGVGFNTVSLVAIPETSTSLLGAIGALALLRRRRN